ncbi:PPOX class F420-dependent oxidoreductase [Streptomyces capparidis]
MAGLVSQGTRVGKLSTVRADGSPHVTPVWFLLDGTPTRRLQRAGCLGARYMGKDRAQEYAARNGGPGNLLVRARIEKVIAFAGIAD